MRICIFGAGAIGGMIAALLKESGANVSIIARGNHYKKIRDKGLSFYSKELNIKKNVMCDTFLTTKEAGTFDLIFVTMKAHSVALVAEDFKYLLKNDTIVVPAINGIPWWYFYNLKGPYENTKITSVDPKNKQWSIIGPEKIIGCVVYPAATILEPGVVEHSKGRRLILGELNNSKSKRVMMISELLTKAKFKAPISRNIRNDIWLKLLGNVSFNPISVLTGGNLKQMIEDEKIKAIIYKMMEETLAIANKLGSHVRLTIESRIEGARKIGEHKPSTLQDFEAKKPLEIDALIKTVSELGRIVNKDTPTIDLIYTLVKLRAITAKCYPNID